MKTKLIGIALAITLGSVVIAMAQSQSTNQATSSSVSTTASAANSDAATHSVPKPATAKSKKELTPDQMYKANCTRCHSELPTMDARRTATIVRHMRIRANLTEREAHAIFEYLKK